MSYDLKILVLDQEKPIEKLAGNHIIIENEMDGGTQRYHTIWPFMTHMNGVWYSLITDRNEPFGAFEICASDFNMDESEIQMPYWVDDSSVRYDLTPLIIYNDYKDDFDSIVSALIELSPRKTILFLARYQGNDKEIVCGVLTKVEFKVMLQQKRILFNVCYIIRDC